MTPQAVFDLLLDRNCLYAVANNPAQPQFIRYTGDNAADFIKYQYICLNPLTLPRRTVANLAKINAIVIEHDSIDKTEQLELIYRYEMPTTCIIDSANKSYHVMIRFVDAITNEQQAELVRLLKIIYPLADKGVLTDKARLVRTPFATRKSLKTEDKHTAGRLQAVEIADKRYTYGHVLAWAHDTIKAPEPQPQPQPQPQQSIISNNYGGACADDLDLVKEATINVLLTAAGVCDDRDGWLKLLFALKAGGIDADTAMAIFSNSAGHNPAADRRKYDTEQPNQTTFATATAMAKKANLPLFNSTLSELKRARHGTQTQYQHQTQQQAAVADIIPPTATTAADKDKEINAGDLLGECNFHLKSADKTALVVQAATGVGKTATILQLAKNYCQAGQKITIITGTVNEARRLFAELREIAGLVISGNNNNESDDDDGDNYGTTSTINANKVLITTYGYLGRKGHTAQTYKLAQDLFAHDRILLCDEATDLFGNKIEYSLPLNARYNNNTTAGGGYSKAHHCQKDCQTCFSCDVKKAPDKLYKQRKFYYELEATTKILTQTEPKNPPAFTVVSDLLPVAKTCSLQQLQSNISVNVADFGNDTSLAAYYLHLKSTLFNPHLFKIHASLLDAPIDQQTILQLADDTKAKIVYPSLPCGLYLRGYDLLPLFQLLNSNKVIFFSATLEAQQIKVLAEACRHKQTRLEAVKIGPRADFNVSCIFVADGLSNEVIATATAQITQQTGKKAFCVAARKRQYTALAASLRAKEVRTKEFCLQSYRASIDAVLDWQGEADYNALVTYALAAICKGANLPQYNILFLDCKLHLPRLALSCDFSSKIDIAKQFAEQQQIKQRALVRQVLGRLLRHKDFNNPDMSRQIVAVLHNAGQLLNADSLDASLFATFTGHHDAVSALPNRRAKTLADAIGNCLKGEPPTNQAELDKQYLANKRQNELSKQQREISQQQRIERKKADLDAKSAERVRATADKINKALAKGLTLARAKYVANFLRCTRSEQNAIENY
jgi:hypothetical protein